MTRSLARTVAPWFVLVAAITLGMGWITLRMVRSSTYHMGWVEHTHVVLVVLGRLHSHLVEAESSARGFALTGKPSQLARFQETLPLVGDKVRSVRDETTDNPRQQGRIIALAGLIEERIAFLEALVRLKRVGPRADFEARVRSDRGLKMMERITLQVREMALEEERLLVDRRRTADRSRRLAVIAVAVAASANLLIIGFVFRVIARAIDRLSRAEVSLRASQAEASKMAMVAARTHHAVMILDVEGRVEWINDGFERVTEYGLDEVLGKRVDAFLFDSDADRAIVDLALRQNRDGMSCRVEFVASSKSGRRFRADFEGQTVADPPDGTTKIIVMMSDVTERHRDEGRIAVQHAVTRILAEA